MQFKDGANVLLGVSGGISAYKACELVRILRKSGFCVETIFTQGAQNFVSPLVISTFTEKAVWLEEDFLSQEKGYKIPHIALAAWADVIAIAPATANVLRIAASGDASTLLGAALLAARVPVLIFPAMNEKMWEHPATQKHVSECKELGYNVFSPDEGLLACGAQGKGRLPEPEIIALYVKKYLYQKNQKNHGACLEGKNVVVTAGPTHEYIDPVRYISNPSTGLMGVSMAKAAWYMGAKVTLIMGEGVDVKNLPPDIAVVPIKTADDMYEACMKYSASYDVMIKAAAVGDFKVEKINAQKIKRFDGCALTLELVQNRDIAAALGAIKKPSQILVGFAAETADVVKNAHEKLAKKGLDVIVANDVTCASGGFASKDNAVTVITKDGQTSQYSGPKEEIAFNILEDIIKYKNNLNV